MFEHRGSFFRPPDGHVVGSIPPRLHRGAGLDAQLRSCGGSQGRGELEMGTLDLQRLGLVQQLGVLRGHGGMGLLGSDGVFCL